jgi:hypothetical protein
MNDIGGTLNLVNPYTAGKNIAINGAMNVWQRGTSFSLAASTVYTSGFTADRWQTATGVNQACTVSRQATGDTTNLPFIQYAMRYQRNAGQTGTTSIYVIQNFESAASIPLAGKTVTVSYYARAGANYSPTSSLLYGTLYSGTGTDQNGFGTYTGATSVAATTATLTTTWQRFTATGTMSASATELNMQFVWAPIGTAGTNDYFEVTGVQVEASSVATPFQTASGTIGGELALCQRYYWRSTGGSVYAPYGMALAASTVAMQIGIVFPVPMRVNPTSVDSSTLQANDGSTVLALSAVALSNPSTVGTSLSATVVGATQYRVYQVGNNNSLSAYLGFSAEL